MFERFSPFTDAASSIYISTESVLSKFGLNDGDSPWWWYDVEESNLVDWDDLLFALVEDFWAASLPEPIELYKIYTTHNPVGVKSYGDVEMPDDIRHAKSQDIIPNVVVDVDPSDILKTIRKITNA